MIRSESYIEPQPTTTDTNEYEAGQKVRIVIEGTIARVFPAGNGAAMVKVDTEPTDANLGSYLSFWTGDPNIAIEITEWPLADWERKILTDEVTK